MRPSSDLESAFGWRREKRALKIQFPLAMSLSDFLPLAWTSQSTTQSPLRQPFSEVLLALGLIVILGTCGRMFFSGRRKLDVRGKVRENTSTELRLHVADADGQLCDHSTSISPAARPVLVSRSPSI